MQDLVHPQYESLQWYFPGADQFFLDHQTLICFPSNELFQVESDPLGNQKDLVVRAGWTPKNQCPKAHDPSMQTPTSSLLNWNTPILISWGCLIWRPHYLDPKEPPLKKGTSLNMDLHGNDPRSCVPPKSWNSPTISSFPCCNGIWHDLGVVEHANSIRAARIRRALDMAMVIATDRGSL